MAGMDRKLRSTLNQEDFEILRDMYKGGFIPTKLEDFLKNTYRRKLIPEMSVKYKGLPLIINLVTNPVLYRWRLTVGK